jgi:hypothetical protein
VSRRRGIEDFGRAPVPEWQELALAAWPGRVPPALSAWCGRMNLTLFALGLVVQFAAAWLKLPVVGLVAWLLAAAVDWLSTRSDPPTSRLLDLVGLRPQARALLRSLAAAAVVFASGLPNAVSAGLGYVAVVFCVQLSWFVQPALATWAWRSAPPLRYLPGAGRQPAVLVRHARVYARAVGTPVVLFLAEAAALVDATWAETLPTTAELTLLGVTISVALAEAALIHLGWTAWQAYALRRDARKNWEPLLAELTELAPSFCVYVSLGARQAKYIANQWLPALDQVQQDGLLLVREASQLAELVPTRHPVVYAPAPRDVERLTLPSLKAAFYLAYGERNGQLQRDPRLKHVMLLHGDSDKATSANNLARGVDEVWVAGPAAIDRYTAAGIELGRDRFAVIGRPQVAELAVGPTTQSPKILLYAPTFEGYYDQTSYSSLDRMGVRLVRRILAKHPDVRVWFRPHPASGVHRPSMLTALTEINTILRHAGDGHRVTADDDLSLTECLDRADVLVSDISSVATDFLYTERPIITCNPSAVPAEEFVKAFPTQAASYLVGPRLEELDDVLAAALGDDPLKPARIEMKKHVLGDTPDGPQAAFAANVARVTA